MTLIANFNFIHKISSCLHQLCSWNFDFNLGISTISLFLEKIENYLSFFFSLLVALSLFRIKTVAEDWLNRLRRKWVSQLFQSLQVQQAGVHCSESMFWFGSAVALNCLTDPFHYYYLPHVHHIQLTGTLKDTHSKHTLSGARSVTAPKLLLCLNEFPLCLQRCSGNLQWK